MLTLTLFFVFVIIIAATWFMGLWSNLLTLLNLIISATIASGFFQFVANQLDNYVADDGQLFAGQFKNHTYLLDFLCLWGVFILSFVFLRGATDMLSKYRVKFDKWTELAGRSVASICIAWVFICFSTFTLHTAPLPINAFAGDFQSTPTTRNFLGIGPDRMWMAYVQSRSMGALSRSTISEASLHPEDRDSNTQPFDSKGEFIYKYQHRREVFAEQEGTLVNREW